MEKPKKSNPKTSGPPADNKDDGSASNFIEKVMGRSISTAPDTFEEDEGMDEDTPQPETLLSAIMGPLKFVAEGGAITEFRKMVEANLPDDKEDAELYVKAMVRLRQTADQGATAAQEAFWVRFR